MLFNTKDFEPYKCYTYLESSIHEVYYITLARILKGILWSQSFDDSNEAGACPIAHMCQFLFFAGYFSVAA